MVQNQCTFDSSVKNHQSRLSIYIFNHWFSLVNSFHEEHAEHLHVNVFFYFILVHLLNLADIFLNPTFRIHIHKFYQVVQMVIP